MLSMVLPECNSMGLSLLPGKSFEDVGLMEESKQILTHLLYLKMICTEGQMKNQSMNFSEEADR